MLPKTPKTHEGPRASLGTRRERATPARAGALEPRRIAVWLVTAVVLYGAFEVLRPLAAPLVLGAWAAHLSRPIFLRTSRAFRGRQKAAALLTTLLVLFLVTPFVVGVTALVPAAQSLLAELRDAQGGRGLLSALVSGDGGVTAGDLDLAGLAKDYGASASKALGAIATASANVVIGVFVLLATFFSLLVEGERAYAWMERRAPVDPYVVRRFTDAFYEAGRGLLVGNGVTALVQGILAGIVYAALGVPRALLLGLLSVVGAMIPVTGPGLVWVPVAAGLALTGHLVKALILCLLGVFVVGTVDNLMRPWLSRRAHVGLSTTVVLVSMFGGMAAFGPWGLVLGPAVVRLATEALDLVRESDALSGRSTRGSA